MAVTTLKRKIKKRKITSAHRKSRLKYLTKKIVKKEKRETIAD